jgi:glyoxylase-like metal-dependent hydrolase (beta-lactamase superfamily II)
VRGGAETTYPEWRAKGILLKPPTAQFTLKPTYTDASTKVAEQADARPKRPPTYDKVESLHAAGNVYMIAGAGGNIAASVGGDGVLLVDSGAEQAVDKVLAAIEAINKEMRPPERPESASPFADTWQATHAFAPTNIRTIINTSAIPDHVGGNAKIRNARQFHPLGVLGEEEQGSEIILAQENTAKHMGEMGLPDDGIPTNTYFSARYNMHRFFNDQAVQVMHMDKALTDGDSVVLFRKSDVIATGDIYIADQYPPIDVDRGGSIDGEITALNKVFDLCVTEFMAQGGTVIIPGHGWLGDAADLGYYRDMLTVIRERIQKMVDGNMTLAQVKAAKPTMDYDVEYGREPGVTAKFVEAVYRSISDKKKGK